MTKLYGSYQIAEYIGCPMDDVKLRSVLNFIGCPKELRGYVDTYCLTKKQAKLFKKRLIELGKELRGE